MPCGVHTLSTRPSSISCPAHFRTSAKEAEATAKTVRPFCWRRFASPTRSRYDRMSSFRATLGSFRRKYSAISLGWNWIELIWSVGITRSRTLRWSSRKRADRSSIRTRSETPWSTTLWANGAGRLVESLSTTAISPAEREVGDDVPVPLHVEVPFEEDLAVRREVRDQRLLLLHIRDERLRGPRVDAVLFHQPSLGALLPVLRDLRGEVAAELADGDR